MPAYVPDVGDVIWSDQSLDWRARRATKASKPSKETLGQVRGKITALLGLR